MGLTIDNSILSSSLLSNAGGFDLPRGGESEIIDAFMVNMNQVNNINDAQRNSSNPFLYTIKDLQRSDAKVYLLNTIDYNEYWSRMALNQINLYGNTRTSDSIDNGNLYGAQTRNTWSLYNTESLNNPAYFIDAVTPPSSSFGTHDITGELEIKNKGEVASYKYQNGRASVSDISEYVYVRSLSLYNQVGNQRVIINDLLIPCLAYKFSSYQFYNPESGAETLIENVDGVLLQNLLGLFKATTTQNRTVPGKNYKELVLTNYNGDVVFDSRFDIYYASSTPTNATSNILIRKSALTNLLNFIGIPWSYTLSEVTTELDPTKFTDGYNPKPYEPVPGQDNNTFSDWTGAGDNSEDSFKQTTPHFSPYGSVVNQYAMNGLQVQQFTRELFRGSWITNPDLFNNDPKEGLVSCRYYPFNVRFHDESGIGNNEHIVVGGVEMEYSSGAKILPNYNQILDLGEFKVDEYFGGFLDYQLTTIDVYLPYIGWQQIAATSLMGRTLKIKYIVDIITGDCSCLLTTTNGKIERLENVFSGRMGIDIPILTSNHNENTKQAASSILSAVTAVGGAVATYATGGVGGIAAAGISAAAITNSATDIATMQNHANMGTPISSSSSLWLPQDIIFRITRPRKSEASEFKNRKGYRSNYSTQLKNVTGFVQIDEPFLDGLSLHEGEKEQLTQILKGGIYL